MEDLIRKISLEVYNQQSQLRQFSVTPIDFHIHNGVDSPKIDASNITNLPTGSGGTPGGINTQIQFNNNGTFGGDSGLTYDFVNGILGVHDINNNLQPPSDGFDLSIQAALGTGLFLTTNNIDSMGNPLGDTGGIDIQSDDIDSFNTGNVNIQSGNSTTSGTSGNLFLLTGNASGTTNTGRIVIATGNSTPPNNGRGSLAIYSEKNLEISASGTASSAINIFATGSVNLQAGVSNDNVVTAGKNVIVNSDRTGGGSGNIFLNKLPSGSEDGVKAIYIANAATIPTVTPTSGGVYYVSAGAFYYLGSSGTLTMLAPA